jgi:hypothetical protein
MPKVFRVESARKSPGKCSRCGEEIAAGSPYVWWQFRFRGKTVRCGKAECGPKPADLTSSEYQKAIYALHDNYKFEGATLDDLESERDNAVSDIESLRDETQEKLDNMPEGLQQGNSGTLLQERVDALESAVSDLENVEFDELDDAGEEDQSEDAKKQRLDEFLEGKRDELRQALSNL